MATTKKAPSKKAESDKPAAKRPAAKAPAAKTAAAKAGGKAAATKGKAAPKAAATKGKGAGNAAPKAAATKATGAKAAAAAAKPAAKKAAPKAAAVRSAGNAGNAKPTQSQQDAAKRYAPLLEHIDVKMLTQIIIKLDDMRAESQDIVKGHMQSDLKPREEASDVGDDLDQASNERDREFNLIMHQRHLRRLQQVDEAFERMADGSYGLCEGTDEPINPRRLLIMPLARYSLEYQEQQEKMLGRTMDAGGIGEGDDSFASED